MVPPSSPAAQTAPILPVLNPYLDAANPQRLVFRRPAAVRVFVGLVAAMFLWGGVVFTFGGLVMAAVGVIYFRHIGASLALGCVALGLYVLNYATPNTFTVYLSDTSAQNVAMGNRLRPVCQKASRVCARFCGRAASVLRRRRFVR